MEAALDSQVRADLANEAVRRYGELAEDFHQKMAKRLKRKFHATIDPLVILTLANHFKEIYKFGASILEEFILPSHGKYSSLEDIDVEKFLVALAVQYPEEDKAILRAICGWVIYYEYLR